ncbi:MAG TPA: signal peptidase I [Candidatus Paceibacterota bacterium]|nr:signal peptidase I [Candidatus Paceibacterota bacterium]
MRTLFFSKNTQPTDQEQKIETAPKEESLWDLIKFAFILIAIIVPFRMFVAQPFIVNGASMDPTFHEGDYLIVDELSYFLREPKRGEVAIFSNPANPSQYFIKRIIGLPGETVSVHGNRVEVKNDKGQLVLEEPYLGSSSNRDRTSTLGQDEYFVMGDNREVSYDSRMWGPLKEEMLKGRAFLRLFPPKVISYLPGNYEFEI